MIMENLRPGSSNTYKTCSAGYIWRVYLHHWRIASNNWNWGQNSIQKDLHTIFEIQHFGSWFYRITGSSGQTTQFCLQFPDLKVRVSSRSREMTSSSPPQSLQMTPGAAFKLKLHWHSNHLLHLFSDDQSSNCPRYMKTLLALSMAVAFWLWLMPIPNGQKFSQSRRQIPIQR